MRRRSSDSILGLPLDQARQALEPYGDVVIVPWPDWVTTIPTLDQRVDLTVAEPVDAAAVTQGVAARRPRRRRPAPRRSGAVAGASRYHPPDEPHPRNRPRHAADRARGGRIGDRRRPPAGDDRSRRDARRRRRGAGPRVPRAGRRRAGRRPADRGQRRRGSDGRGRPRLGRRRSGSASRSPSRFATSACPRSRPSGGSGACRAGGPAARRRARSATPSARASTARRRRSSSRTSSTPGARRRGEHPRRPGPPRSDCDTRPGILVGPARQPLPAHGSLRPRAGRPAQVRALRRPARRRRRRRSGSCCSCSCSRRVVLLVMATVARPLVRAVVVPWAWDNPSALQLGVRVRPRARGPRRGAHGPRLERSPPRSSSSSIPATRRRRSRRGSQDAGIIASQRAFLYQARQDDLLPKLNAGRFSLALQPHARRRRRRPGQQPDREPRGHGHVPRGPARRADDRQAADDHRDGGRPQGVLRPRDEPDRRAARRLPLAAGRERPAQGRLARGLPVPGDVHDQGRRRDPDDRRGPGPDDARRVPRPRGRRSARTSPTSAGSRSTRC